MKNEIDVIWSSLNLDEGIKIDPVDDNLLGAYNDRDALQAFIMKAGARSQETKRRYEREISRFTFFIYRELNVNYKQVKLKHLQHYFSFIHHLPLSWTQNGILPHNPDKILFKGKIKKGKSTDLIIDVLSAFFSFLEKNNYINGNPTASLVRSGEKKARGTHIIRYFYDHEWLHLKHCLNNMYSDPTITQAEADRSQYIIAIAYGLALRISEVSNHSSEDIYQDQKNLPCISIVGKGNKRRTLPLNNTLHKIIEKYQRNYGQQNIKSFPLAPKMRRKKNGEVQGMTVRGLRFWWHTFMQYCALKTEDSKTAERFLSIPFHTLRHTALTHLTNTMDLEDLAVFAGHDSINTTSQYYHTELHRLRNLTKEHKL